jgi:hypothetical protein
METTYFTIIKGRQLYIKVGLWCSSKNPPRTPGYIWKESLQAGCYDVRKLRISSAAIKLAKNIGKHFSPIAHFVKQHLKQIKVLVAKALTVFLTMMRRVK